MEQLIHVGVATYNNARHIRACLDSIISQARTNLSIMVTDDASTDETTDILSEYSKQHPDNVRVLINSDNVGAAENVNRLAAFAEEADYYCYIPGDDVMYPGKLKKSIKFLEANPDVGMAYHDCELFLDESDRLLSLYSERFPMRSGGLTEYLSGDMYFSINTVTFRRETLPKPNLFLAEMGPYADLEYLGRAIGQAERAGFAHPVGYLPEALVGYRRHAKNLSNSQDRSVLEYQTIGYERIAREFPDMALLCSRALRERRLIQALRPGESLSARMQLIAENGRDPRALFRAARTLAQYARAHAYAPLRNRLMGRRRSADAEAE